REVETAQDSIQTSEHSIPNEMLRAFFQLCRSSSNEVHSFGLRSCLDMVIEFSGTGLILFRSISKFFFRVSLLGSPSRSRTSYPEGWFSVYPSSPHSKYWILSG